MSRHDDGHDSAGRSNPDVQPPSDGDAEAILTRRNFLIQATLASAGLTLAGAAACEDNEPGPQPCLEPLDDTRGDATTDVPPDPGQPEACLSPPYDTSDQPDVCLSDLGPEVCLSAPQDTYDDTPQVCLEAPLDVTDAADDDMPQPCLTPALDTSDGGDV